MSELAQLVDDLGRRSFDARLGHRGLPETLDEALWRNLEDTGLARLTSSHPLLTTTDPVEPPSSHINQVVPRIQAKAFSVIGYRPPRSGLPPAASRQSEAHDGMFVRSRARGCARNHVRHG